MRQLQKDKIYHFTFENDEVPGIALGYAFYFRMGEYVDFLHSTCIVGEGWMYDKWCITNLPLEVEKYLVPLDRLTALILFGEVQ